MRTIHGLLLVALATTMLWLPACGDSGGFDGGDGGTDTDADTDADADAGGDCAEAWYDPASGLSWAVLPSVDGEMNWQSAADFCDAMALCGDDDWRLPTVDELRSLVRGCPDTETGGACEVTDYCATPDCWNSACDSCAFDEGPDAGCYRPAEMEGSCIPMWTSTGDEESEPGAWTVGFRTAAVANVTKTTIDAGARCVRPGP